MFKTLMIILLVCIARCAHAGIALAPIKSGPTRNPSPLQIDMERVGTLRPRTSGEIAGSSWTLGCECLDRDFADFDEYKDYIVPLGIKEIRLFAGWAKCEKTPGRIDFSWLDHCVDWANTNGINVLLDVSYGNPIYKGAGGAGLANGIPNTPDGLARWDDWVFALGTHYAGRIRDYAMWNEPNNGGMNTPDRIADLNIRTARILRRIMPDCRLHGISHGSNRPEDWEPCFRALAEQGGIDYFDTFIYHGYATNPDSSYARVDKLIEMCKRYAPRARMRQGENGCPSEYSDRLALQAYPWSEYSQAKWDMRRMLGDLAHGVQSGVFTICDLYYGTYPNRKGLLRSNPNKQVFAVKKAYYAVQNVVSVFDNTVRLVPKRRIASLDRCLALHEYETDKGSPLIVFWTRGLVSSERITVEEGDGAGNRRKAWVVGGEFVPDMQMTDIEKTNGQYRPVDVGWQYGIPSDSFETRPDVMEWSGAPLEDPVWVDLFTGAVYAFPEDRQIVHSTGVSFVRVPVYDSPCILTERRALQMIETER